MGQIVGGEGVIFAALFYVVGAIQGRAVASCVNICLTLTCDAITGGA